MNQLLASVTSPWEARTALELGADIVDCKDPALGALGDLAPATIRKIVSTVAGRRRVSATVGDLPTDARILGDAIQVAATTRVDYIKVGLFETDRVARTLVALSPLARRYRLVAVLFADLAPRMGVLTELAAADFTGVMLDTADKENGSLLDNVDTDQLAGFVAQARHHRLFCGLAGSLRPEHIPLLLPLEADCLGFRGALCAGSRTAVMDRARFQRVAKTLRQTDADQRPAA